MHLILSYRRALAKAAELTPADVKRFKAAGYTVTRIKPCSVPFERAQAEARGFQWVEKPE